MFSLRRIPTESKKIDNRVLNLLGVQVLRTVIARSIFELMPMPPSDGVGDLADELRREGIVVLHDLLGAEHFEDLRWECLNLLEVNRDKLEVLDNGPNKVESLEVKDVPNDERQFTQRFLMDQRLNLLMRVAEKRSLCSEDTNWKIQRVFQGSGNEEDFETRLHSDTFFSTHKVWFYLSDVGTEHGPLVYVKRSHQLTLTHLSYVYQESCGPNIGSRRITADEVERLNLPETIVTCPRNTLVVANTFGHHRRLRGMAGHERYALHVQLRTNPFLWWRNRFICDTQND